MRQKASGFTIIELMAAVVVIGILTAIALPNYQNYLVKSARNNAKAVMLDIAQTEERYASNQIPPTYIGISALPAAAPSGFQNWGGGGDPNSRKYDITVVAGSTGSLTTSISIIATPVAGVFNDPTCGTLVLNNLGIKVPTTSGCW